MTYFLQRAVVNSLLMTKIWSGTRLSSSRSMAGRSGFKMGQAGSGTFWEAVIPFLAELLTSAFALLSFLLGISEFVNQKSSLDSKPFEDDKREATPTSTDVTTDATSRSAKRASRGSPSYTNSWQFFFPIIRGPRVDKNSNSRCRQNTRYLDRPFRDSELKVGSVSACSFP